MSSQQSVQTLLRFLSQDAKVPLAQALAQIKHLQSESITSIPDIAKADITTLKPIFSDEKLARQVLNAAKRVSKKRSASDDASPTSPPPARSSKKIKPLFNDPLNAKDLEASLTLPTPELNEATLKSAVLYTNRAPLVLAFTLVLTKFTMPEQPLSSRLSLAQAVTSMNSKSKAVSIGLEAGKAVDEEGWGVGQPSVRVLGREVRVMKRWGYEWDGEESTQGTVTESTQSTVKQDDESQDTAKEEPEGSQQTTTKEPALWAIDLEALRKANQSGSNHPPGSQLPIYTAQSARSYLLKAFESAKPSATTEVKTEKGAPTKRTAASMTAEKERNLGRLLGALELLFRSWALLSKEELDSRAWGWYVRVRPDVAHGTAGWGGKGNVKLSDILDLRRSD
ncbi:hypothetical protein NX059_006329 [Plenodomus lindquistii]|nr:hypothetical protein NX059_006329 [Plenodomus lindquistii]